ncbi:MAG: hypothetical protein Q9163_002622 [Psora crenata]
MPRKSPYAYHHLPYGQQRHLDTLFRQLRYENTESIIDACYHASQQLAVLATQSPTAEYDDRSITPRKSRYSLFRDVAFEDIMFHPSRGLLARVSFACPRALRGRRMGVSGQLEEGMLVALIGLGLDGGLSTTFMEIYQRQTTEAMRRRTGNDLRERFVLVELPNALYASFYHTLRRMQDQSRGDNEIAFLSCIAPSSPDASPSIIPPDYAEGREFAFQLDCLRPKAAKRADTPVTIRPQDVLFGDRDLEEAIDQLCDTTTLDRGQATALCENLCRGLAFTQGPPGTGKTYLGVALAKVLLASRSSTPRKPILVVCLTNHALDSFLSDLRNAGIINFARMGAGSKEAWTQEFELRKLGHKLKKTTFERTSAQSVHHQVEGLWVEGTSWCESLNSDTLSWPAVREYLANHDPSALTCFTELETVDQAKLSDIRLARKAGGFAFEFWCSGGDLDDVERLIEHFTYIIGNDISSDLDDDAITTQTRVISSICWNADTVKQCSSTVNLWALSLKERENLLQYWKRMIEPRTILDRTAEIHRRHYAAMQRKRATYEGMDARCLANREPHRRVLAVLRLTSLIEDIIAATTTACAKQYDMLKDLGIQTVICEEAGEVMEAQSLCSLFPTVKHAISIGDPLQLRPQVKEISLSLESDVGSEYRLDESLMERLMIPSASNVHPIPASRLNLQRRMHPEIANIMRATLYPYLQDHQSTWDRPSVPGIADRIWWLDHHELEDSPDRGSTTAQSFSNAFEVEMVAGLVEYFVGSNEYEYKDITVLTPYNGQLAAFNARFKSICSLWLSEKDREALLTEGYLDLESVGSSQSVVEVGNMLKLATIDNFQGEESKIVILSTVRSNLQRRVGFLKTPNRINVGCSRARDGFYIVGNALLMRQIPMWRQIIDFLTTNRKIGPYFCACCPRHPEIIYRVMKPHEWYTVPECKIPCDFIYNCGHSCPMQCHAHALHERQGCLEPCGMLHEPCKHPCTNACGEPCGDCTQSVLTLTLECGHQAAITCAEMIEGKGGDDVKCSKIVGNRLLACGHSQDIICSAQDRAYDVGPSGQIRGISRESISGMLYMNARCPTCGADCRDVPRYAIFDQVNKLTNSIDSVQSYFSRKIYTFLDQINHIRIDLNYSFDGFSRALRPGPLAARQNEKLVLERGNALAEVETRICRLKDELVQPFEDATKSLVGFLGNSDVLQDLTFASVLRLESLYYRCRLITLEENARILIPLRDMAQQSQHSEILAEGLRHVTIPRIVSQLQGIRASVLKCQNKQFRRLEVELRLIQLASQVVLDNIGSKNMLLGASTELGEIMQLCRKFPLTAGLLMPSCQQIRPFILRSEAKCHPLYSKITQDIWWAWPRHSTGDLLYCENKHPYSGISSSHCPECGPEAQFDKLKVVDLNATLRAKDWVAAMKAHSFNAASYRSL